MTPAPADQQETRRRLLASGLQAIGPGGTSGPWTDARLRDGRPVVVNLDTGEVCPLENPPGGPWSAETWNYLVAEAMRRNAVTRNATTH